MTAYVCKLILFVVVNDGINFKSAQKRERGIKSGYTVNKVNRQYYVREQCGPTIECWAR
jgi:hypothetical protein